MLGKKVRELRKQLRMTQQELADEVARLSDGKVSVTDGRISQIESTEWAPSTDDLCYYMAKALKTTPEIIMNQAPEQTEEPVISVPIVGFVPCGTPFPSDQSREGYLEIPITLLGGKTSEHLFAVRASGESLLGDDIQKGDYLIVDRYADFVSGAIYVILKGSDVMCRHCYQETDMMKIIGSSGQYDTAPLEDVQILGRVILSGKWQTH